jgi:hypothetical protein
MKKIKVENLVQVYLGHLCHTVVVLYNVSDYIYEIKTYGKLFFLKFSHRHNCGSNV